MSNTKISIRFFDDREVRANTPKTNSDQLVQHCRTN